MKLKLIVFANYFFALIALVLATFFSGVSLSSYLPIFFPQFAVLVALTKYYHVKNVLRAAGDLHAIRQELKPLHAVMLIFASIVLLYLAASFFRLDMEYKITILISGVLAILTFASVFIVLYPILVKLDAGIYKKVTK